MDKELWNAMMEWLEIQRQSNEQLAEIRRELAEFESLEKPKPDMLRVKLY